MFYFYDLHSFMEKNASVILTFLDVLLVEILYIFSENIFAKMREKYNDY